MDIKKLSNVDLVKFLGSDDVKSFRPLESP